MPKFITTLWSGRERRTPSPSVQEKAVASAMYPPHRNVLASPIKPPVKDGKR